MLGRDSSGCLEKLKRGLEGTPRVAASFDSVGRKERPWPSAEATLAPLVILRQRLR